MAALLIIVIRGAVTQRGSEPVFSDEVRVQKVSIPGRSVVAMRQGVFGTTGTITASAGGVITTDHIFFEDSATARQTRRLGQEMQWSMQWSHFDKEGRPHREDGHVTGYVIKWDINGDSAAPRRLRIGREKAYFWHGVQVPQWVIEDRDTITVRAIEETQNVEVRRAMMEAYLGKESETDGVDGVSRYIRDCRADLIDDDSRFGKLWQKTLHSTAGSWTNTDRITTSEVITMVEVINSTVEKDGSRKRYFLRVPNDMRTSRQAVAWTWGMKSKDYNPAKET